jgi:hypothetical protein
VAGTLVQSDACGWMAVYALAMGAMAEILRDAGMRPDLDLVLKFLEHFAAIRTAMDRQGMWDAQDGLLYDGLVSPDGTAVPVRTRSMVGIIPVLTAATTVKAGATPLDLEGQLAPTSCEVDGFRTSSLRPSPNTKSASLGANAETWSADRRPLSNSRFEYRSARNGESSEKWSGRRDLNPRPLGPQPRVRCLRT